MKARLHRTQLMLEEEQYRRLRSRAKQAKKSMSATVREILERAFAEAAPRKPGSWLEGFDEIARMAPKGKYKNAGRDHDKILYRRDW